jgi:transposase
MLQLTPQMRVLVVREPVDGRKGIDSLARLCRELLGEDPFSGCVFIFRSRNREAVRVLVYDGQGYWLAQKRLSQGRFRWWVTDDGPATALECHQAQVLLAAGDPTSARTAPPWKPLQRIVGLQQVHAGASGTARCAG